MKNIIQVSAIILALLGSACGPEDKNPTEDYNFSDATSTPASIPGIQTTMTQLFQIDALDHLTFVQGEKKEVRFSVRTGFSHPEEVHYSLNATQIPREFGASFRQEGQNWILSWTPGDNILNSAESYKSFPIELKFVLSEQSSARVKAQFAGHHDTKKYETLLMKSPTQPIIEDEVKILPSKVIQPTDLVKIEFVVAAKGLDAKQALNINIYEGPSAPSRELVQMNGQFAISKKAARLATLGKDKEGRTRYKYQVEFKSKTFVDELLLSFETDPLLKKRYLAGQIPTAEAAFSIEAFNPYNKMSSAERLMILNVTLPVGGQP